MKIAVASDDGLSVSQHFGRARRFVVFQVADNVIVHEEDRAGIAVAGAEEDCEAQHVRPRAAFDYSAVIAALADCQAVLCRGMGWHAASQLVLGGINPLVFQGDVSPREAVQQYLCGTLQPASGFCRCQTRE